MVKRSFCTSSWLYLSMAYVNQNRHCWIYILQHCKDTSHIFSLSSLLLFASAVFLPLSIYLSLSPHTHKHTHTHTLFHFVCVLIWEQAMVTLRGMVKHRLSNVFKQHLTLLWFLCKSFFPLFPIPPFSTFPFFDMFFLFLN